MDNEKFKILIVDAMRYPLREGLHNVINQCYDEFEPCSIAVASPLEYKEGLRDILNIEIPEFDLIFINADDIVNEMNKLVNYFKQNADATQKIKVLYNQNDLDWDKQYAGSDKSTKKFLSQLDKLPHKICIDEENKIEIMVETILAKQQEQKQDIGLKF